MKNITNNNKALWLIILLIIIGNSLHSQTTELWGVTSGGGTNGWGIVYKTDANGNNKTTKHSFSSPNGARPEGSLLQLSNGEIYGVTSRGGSNGNGVIFTYDIVNNVYQKKIDFVGSNGARSVGSLIQANNGKIYGTTALGGSNGIGVIFEYDHITNILTVLHNFQSIDGNQPNGHLIQANNGKLYGFTRHGGANNLGVIFEYDISTNTFTKKIDFNTANGKNPLGSLMQASNGKLYGYTLYGGIIDKGVLFEFDVNTGVLTKKKDFTNSTGNVPHGALIQADNGKLYGTASRGGTHNGGTLFEYNISTNVLSVKKSFDQTVNGSGPRGALMQASNGNIYGTTLNDGKLFEYNIITDVLTIKASFNGGQNGSASYYGHLIEIGTIFWTGNTSTDWHTASNWSSNSVPTLNDIAIIPDVSLMSGNFPVITPASSIGATRIAFNASLTVVAGIELFGKVINHGTTTFKNGAYLDDFTNINAEFLGEAVFERTAANGVTNDQRMISSPVNTPNVSEIGDDLIGPWGVGLVGTNGVAITVDNCNIPTLTPSSNYGNLFEFDETLVSTCALDGWVVRSSGSLENGRGYSAYLADGSTFDFVGTPNTGLQTISTTNTGSSVSAGEGWNLLGNPYPSPISRNAVILAGATDAQYFVTSGIYQGSYFPYLPGSDIAIAQGFQVHTATNQTISFDDSFRSSSAATWYSTESWFDHKLEISVLGNSFADKTILYYSEDATDNYEPLDDVVKLKSKHGYPSLSTSSAGRNLALNGLSNNDIAEIVPLNLDPGNDGNFSLSFEGLETFPLNTTVYIKDLLLNQIHDISDGDYNFTSNVSDNPARFELFIIPSIEFETAKVSCSGNPGAIALSSIVGLENRVFELASDGAVISSDILANLDQDLAAGIYDLVVYDDFNGSQTYTFEIEELEGITADFVLSSLQVSPGELFTMENLTSNSNNVLWELGNESFANLDILTYSFATEGVYEIVLIVANDDCMDELLKEINVVNKATSIREQNFSNLKVYPNPTQGLINMDLNESLNSIRLLSITGQIVVEFDANERSLDISRYPSGIYFLELQNASAKSIVKVIKE